MKTMVITLLLMMSVDLYGAEAVVEKPTPQPTTNQATAPVKKPERQSEQAAKQKSEAVPTDTLGGTGLKNRNLSEVFEQFVPSESISADNAVPFPVDI